MCEVFLVLLNYKLEYLYECLLTLQTGETNVTKMLKIHQQIKKILVSKNFFNAVLNCILSC